MDFADASAPVDAMAAWLLGLDDGGHIQWANATLEDALGISRRRLQGRSLASLLVDAGALERAFAKAQGHDAQKGDPARFRFDAFVQTGPQATPLAVLAHLSRREDGQGWLLEMWPRAGRDGTQGAAREHELETMRNLAHEIKNPLGGIRGAAQLLDMELGEREGKGDGEAADGLREYTQVVMREVDRLQSLVDRLLEPHRHALTLAPVNIHEVCEHVRTLVLMEFASGLSIEPDYDISLPEVMGDRQQLVQVLFNLMQNAAQALRPQMAEPASSPSAARIVIRTRVVYQTPIGEQLHKRALQLQVIDNGPGIDPDLQERIFHPLVTGRADGTGLGLSLAQTFVRRHAGVLTCESAPGCTRFVVTLPLP